LVRSGWSCRVRLREASRAEGAKAPRQASRRDWERVRRASFGSDSLVKSCGKRWSRCGRRAQGRVERSEERASRAACGRGWGEG
jgi:hypothetical protein